MEATSGQVARRDRAARLAPEGKLLCPVGDAVHRLAQRPRCAVQIAGQDQGVVIAIQQRARGRFSAKPASMKCRPFRVTGGNRTGNALLAIR